MTRNGTASGTAVTEPVRGRSLKTASEVLQVLRILGSAPAGLSVDELAARLAKSKATAQYLLNSLRFEGFAVRDPLAGTYQLTSLPPWGCTWGDEEDTAPAVPDELSDAVDELYEITRQRVYLAHLEDSRIALLHARGRQGLAKVPGLAERAPASAGHALAITKVLAAGAPGLRGELVGEGNLQAFTASTVTDPACFDHALECAGRDGFATDREEFAEGFCCVAAPILNPAGKVAASLGLSVLAHQYALHQQELIGAVIGVAAAATNRWRQRAAPSTHPGAGSAPAQATTENN
jgi:DNA-binding IclR family transcriptional regulator